MAIADLSNKSLSDLISLKDKVAVVTGGTKGIGFAISQRLAEAGGTVLVAGRDKVSADEAAAKITNGKAVGAQVEASDPASLTALCDRAINEFGRLDVWVNNAGIFPYQPTLEVTDSEWQKVLNVNLSGVFFGSREAALRMLECDRGGEQCGGRVPRHKATAIALALARNERHPKGVIINVSSIGGLRGAAGMAAYAAAKHGVEGLTKSLAIEFGSIKTVDGESYRHNKMDLRRLNDRSLAIADVVQEIAKELGREPAQVALNWIRQQGIIPILGARKLSHMKNNLGCLEFELSLGQMAPLNKISQIEMGFPYDFYPTVRQGIYGNTLGQIDHHRADQSGFPTTLSAVKDSELVKAWSR